MIENWTCERYHEAVGTPAETKRFRVRVRGLGRNRAVPGHQNTGLLPLPYPRRHRVLPVLGRYPPVKDEFQPAAARRTPAATSGLLSPQHQSITAPSPAPQGVLSKRHGNHPPASRTSNEPPHSASIPAIHAQSPATRRQIKQKRSIRSAYAALLNP